MTQPNIDDTAAVAGATLELRLVSDLTGEFFIPRYQRGYRWGRIEVLQLLDDLVQSGGNPYCLQPVVVKRIADQHWELVDGQQRLTTLYLLLRFMERANLQRRGPRYTLRYETREGSAAFLHEPEPSQRGENVDFFHIAGAYEAISDWFKTKGHEDQVVANDLFGYLHKSVRVIWYEAPPELDATTLFTRLNVGRIPLTDAELVKALLLTTAPLERRREIAQQWDQIERELHDDELWAFVSSAEEAECPTRITLLFDALAQRGPAPKHARFDTFETLRTEIVKAPLVFWNRALDLHGLVRGWFEDRSVYHKVGFLVATGETFRDLVAMAKGLRKSEVEARLDDRIRARIAAAPSDVAALSYDVDSHKEKLQRILLLMNVETVRRRQGSTERYSFHLSRRQHWSLEHIHAQRAEGLNKAEQWVAWLREHRRALDALDAVDVPDATRLAERIDGVLAGTVERRTFDELSQEIAALFTREDDSSASTMHSLHGISNLALLSCDDNAQLNNAVFEVKRRQILELDRAGAFIPICTKQVMPRPFVFQLGSGTNEAAWREVFTAAAAKSPIGPTRAALAMLLDVVAATERVAMAACLERLQAEWQASQRTYDRRWYFEKYPAMREGRSGLYVSTDRTLGFDLCMLDKNGLNSNYRDPYLSAICRAARVGDAIKNGPYTGWQTNPRWMHLRRSGIELRCVADGIAIRGVAVGQLAAFEHVRSRHGIGDDLVLRSAQTDVDGRRVDTSDRIEGAATFLDDLVAAGL